MTAEIDTGLSLLVGVILVLAGVQKVRDPRPLQVTLRQLYRSVRGRGIRLARCLAVGIGTVEIVTGVAGAALRGPAGLAAAGMTIGLCCGFLLALRRALRIGAGCSCFGYLSRTAVGGRELGRAVALLGIATAMAALRVGQPGPLPSVGWPTALAIGGGAAAVLLAMAVGERLRPATGPTRAPALARLRGLTGFDGRITWPNKSRLGRLKP
jgi:hypothetical protein